MAIVVSERVRIRANGKEYELGEIISGLDKSEEKRLVKEGYCDFVATAKPPKDKKAGENDGAKDSGSNSKTADDSGDDSGDDNTGGPNTSLPGTE
jgi:hypothetical protein